MSVNRDKCDTKLSKKGKKLFLTELIKPEVAGRVNLACKRIAVPRQTVYRWRDTDTAFAENWDAAVWSARQNLADMAEMALYRSVLANNVKACIFTLKHLRPEIYSR